MHPVYVPVLYELTALRLFAPFWPSGEHYCRFPGAARAKIHVRTSSLEYPDLLAHHLDYQFETGFLAGAWRVCAAPHLAGSDGTTVAIEPASDDLDHRELADDLLRIGTDLAASVRRLARARVVALGAPAPIALESAGPGAAAPQDISPREREVLELFLSGLGVASLGRRLFISPHTVRNHLKHICAKLGVSSQRELRELFALASA